MAQEGLARLERLRATPNGERDGEPYDGQEPGGDWAGEHDREATIEEITAEVSWRLQRESDAAMELLRVEREGLEEALEALRELIAEARDVVRPAHQPAADDGVSLIEADLNRGTHAELCAVGMSDTQAARVIRHRDHWGEFQSVDELDHVPGFVPELREDLKNRLTAEPATAD